jgi:hypothetical protein
MTGNKHPLRFLVLTADSQSDTTLAYHVLRLWYVQASLWGKSTSTDHIIVLHGSHCFGRRPSLVHLVHPTWKITVLLLP